MKRKSLIIIWKVLQWHGTTWLIHREIVRQLDKEMFKLHLWASFPNIIWQSSSSFPKLKETAYFPWKEKGLTMTQDPEYLNCLLKFCHYQTEKVFHFNWATVGHSLELNYLTLTTTPDAPILVKRQFIYTTPHQNHKVNQLWIINLT